MVFRAIKRKVNADMFLFAKIKKFVIEQRAVCIYCKVQLEIACDFAVVHGFGYNRFCKIYTFVDGIPA